MTGTRARETDHWLALASPDGNGSRGCRIESVGVKLPARRLTTKDLMSRTRHRTRIQLERLTGIHERRVVGPGENSFTLAAGAARDCLAHSLHQASDIEMLINTSITRSKGEFSQSFEPPLSLYVKQAIGAPAAVSFDLSNACAGMLTGVFLLQDFIARGEISCGMVVSGEYISHLSWNAAKQVRSLFSQQLASLTLGDAGAAVIVERAPRSAPGIEVIGFTTLAEHSRLCLAFPSTVGPGAQMYTRSRTLQKVAIQDMPTLVDEVIGKAGINLADIDYLIPHQTSARAIRKGTQEFARQLEAKPKHVVVNLEEYGNTSSTPAGGHGTFSFDLMNGTCAVISAIQLEAGFLHSGVIRLGAIVTSDVDPEPGAARSVCFRPAGGAMLLAWDDGVAGFTDFGAETFPEYEDLFISGLVWHDRSGPRAPWRGPGQSQMVIDEKPGYQARLADCAEEATRRFLRRIGMGIDEIDLLVAAPSAPGFLDRLRVSLGVPGDRVGYVAEDLDTAYTTGPLAALQAAVRSGRLGEARSTLMLAAGAGLTVVHALYRQ